MSTCNVQYIIVFGYFHGPETKMSLIVWIDSYTRQIRKCFQNGFYVVLIILDQLNDLYYCGLMKVQRNNTISYNNNKQYSTIVTKKKINI